MSDYVKRQVKDLMSLWANLDSYPVDKLQKLGDRIHQTFNLGGILAFAGNGGSAAEASHLAAEFTGRCVRDHRPLPAINLGESVSAFSATTNDYSFEDSFLRNSQAFLNSKSVVIALSTSGSSPNIVRLIEDATSRVFIQFSGQAPNLCTTVFLIQPKCGLQTPTAPRELKNFT